MDTHKSPVRVRFAPSPTGMLHLGNVRVAVINYLFALRYKGTFILRIEDTDQTRTVDSQATGIINDLKWLGLTYQEGPHGGPHAPYFQSQRTALYAQKLQELIDKNAVYRCFCSPEELDKKRKRQIALKLPPRYDRTCLQLSPEQIHTKIEQETPFIWRLKTTSEQTVIITDLAHGTISFHMKDFADLPLTRSDGTYTFIFANCVDDVLMRITHIIRGEDHLTNTAGQAVLYQALGASVPTFWHLPIMANTEGKKLSKRDFGFSLNDLRDAGYIPEAICNYLSIIGGSFAQEIMSLSELAHTMDFEHMHATGQIRYSIEKLRWVNHKWISRLDLSNLTARCLPYLKKTYPHLREEQLPVLIRAVQPELITLQDAVAALACFYETPQVTPDSFTPHMDMQKVMYLLALLKKHEQLIATASVYLDTVKKEAVELNQKEFFGAIRIILTGKPHGLGIKDLLTLLSAEQIEQRIRTALTLA